MRQKRNEPRVVKVEEVPNAKNFDELFNFTVERPGGEIEVRIFRNKRNHDAPGFITTKKLKTSLTRPMVNAFWASPIMLDIFEAIRDQATEGLVGLVRKHFGGITPAPPRKLVTTGPDGEKLEAVKCMNCSTEYWSNGRTPCPRCAPNPSMIADGDEVPTFEDFIASGGQIEYVPPSLFPDTPERGNGGRIRVNAPPVEGHHGIIDRMDLSFASPLSGALRPDAPATQDDLFELTTALSKELKRMQDAFQRILEKTSRKDDE